MGRGGGVGKNTDTRGVARTDLDRRRRRDGEAVHRVLRDGADIVYLYKAEALGVRRMSSQVGLRAPMYCTGVGKAILATLPYDEVAEIWRHSRPQKLTGRTAASLDALTAQLADVRRSGYAIDDE